MDIPQIPIVLTGAMRSSNELGSDGVYNYLSALRVASDKKATDKGCTGVMNDEIHAAKYVTKTHTTNVGTFQNADSWPPWTHYETGNSLFQNCWTPCPFWPHSIKGLVPIIPVYAGMTDELLDLLPIDQLDGLIIQAFGAAMFQKKLRKNWTPSFKKGYQSL